MRKVLLSLGLATIALSAVPAAAQSYRYDDRGYGDRGNGWNGGNGQYRDGARQELWRLSQQVDRGIQRGNLTRREADYFRREIAQLRYLDQRYGYGGYNGRERAQLDQRIDRLRDRLRYERSDDDRRYRNW